ncbi:sigma-E processing peptidase SpoIIGA [Pseudoflavonifractor sp.]|jgi:stage II sporulation protein GA (sporulation sigma-E factor processing peptidase)|uniref:sigma-E processing peptidase SpoIIGA n=1 Tax=Pseudoflavonifractor sp. TaxID=1980281 RepID=UPI003D8B3CCF
MTVVYIDSLFLLNFLVNYLLLLAAARLSGAVIRRPSLAMGAALGGGYAAAVFLPGMDFLLHPLCKIGAAVLMLLCAFGNSRRLLRTGLIFFAVAAAFGGGIFAIELLGGRGLSLKNGIFYSTMDLKLILLSAAGCYVVISLVLRRTGGHTAKRELVPAVVTLGERKTMLTALVDTGNTLTDPATNRPVMVAEGEKLFSLFPADAAPGPTELSDPVSALEHMADGPLRGRCRLLPYQAVGVECGMLLAVRMDRVQVGTEDYGGILVALSPNRLSDGGGYSALIGA